MMIILFILCIGFLSPSAISAGWDKPAYQYQTDTTLAGFTYQAGTARITDQGNNPLKSLITKDYVQLKGVGSQMEFQDIPGGKSGKGILLISFSYWNYESKSGAILVNGKQQEFRLKGAGSWDRFNYSALVVELEPGRGNSLIIRSTEKHFPRIKHIVLIPLSPDPVYSVSDNHFTFLPVQGNMNTLQVICNGKWSILSLPDWLQTDKFAGSYLEEIIFKIRSSNVTKDLREGQVRIVFNHSDTISIAVLQYGQDKCTYYVDLKNGRDDYSGNSPDSAWKSVSKINSVVFGPGDSVLFKNGEKWIGPLNPVGSGTEDEPLVFSSYGEGDEKPLIHANGTDQAVMLMNMENVVFENFRVTNPSDAADRRARGIYLFANQPKAFQNITIRNIEAYNVIGWVKQSRRFSSGAIYTDTEGDQSRFVNLTIEDNWIHDCTTRGITGNAGASNWLDTNYMHNQVVIRGNLIDNTGCDGIRTIASKNVIVENNRVFRVGNYTMGEEALFIAACFPQQCGSTLWQYNEIAYTAPTNPTGGDMDSQAFDIDHDCAGTHIFQYNYSHDNVGGFFLLMGKSIRNDDMGVFEKAIIRYNISQNDGNSFPRIFELHDFIDVDLEIRVYNNVFWYNSGKMTIQCKGSYFGGIAFKNNIFYAPEGTYSSMVDLNNNLYFPHNPPDHDGSAINQDPLFINGGSGMEGFSSLGGYQLGSNSPAIGSGTYIPDNGGYDFWNNTIPEDYPPCIGVHQYNIQTGHLENEYKQAFFKGFFPNPSRDSIIIKYYVSYPMRIQIKIYNNRGKLVSLLIDEFISEGDHNIIWNFKDQNGNPVTPGVYLCSIKSSDGAKSNRIIKI